MESLELTFRLLDRVSPTVQVMDRHLAATKNTLASVDKALRDLDRTEKQARFANERDPMKRYRVGLELMREQMTGATHATGQSAGALAAIGGTAGLAAGAAFAVASAFASVARAAVEGSLGVAKFGIEAASFRRDSMTAFELIEGSAISAKDTFDRLHDLADRTPFATGDVITFGKVLRSTGFTIRETEDLLAGMFDVGAVQGKEGPEKVRQLLDGITKIRGRDVLNMESLESILGAGAAAGVNMQSLAGTLAKRRGIGVAQAAALLTSGALKGSDGIGLILDTIQHVTDKDGPLGKATLEFGRKSLDGQLSTFHSRLESLFYDVDLQPLVNILQTVNGLLAKDSPTGKRILEFASETLGGMFRMAERYLTPQNIEAALTKATDLARDLGEAFEVAATVLGQFASGFGEGFSAIPGKVDPVRSALDGLHDALGGEESSKIWREFGRSLGLMVDLTVRLGASVMWLTGHLSALREVAFQALPGADLLRGALGAATYLGGSDAKTRSPTSFERTGNAAGAGLATGLAGASGGANAAAEALALGVVDTTAKTLDIHSPSRVMARLGVHTGDGFTEGLYESDAQRAMTELVEAPAINDSASHAAAGWERTMTIRIGDIHVHGVDAATASRVGEDVRRSLQAELMSLLDDMALAG